MFSLVGARLTRTVAARHPRISSIRTLGALEPFPHANTATVPIAHVKDQGQQSQAQEGHHNEKIPVQGGVFQTSLDPQDEISHMDEEKDGGGPLGHQPSPGTPSAVAKEQNKYHQRLNLTDFRPENVKVTLKQRSNLCIWARQVEDGFGRVHVANEDFDGGNSHRFHLVKELTYRYFIPEDVDVGHLAVSLGKDGFLVVEAPRQHQISSDSRDQMSEEVDSDEIVLEPAVEGREGEEDGDGGSQAFTDVEGREGEEDRSEGDGGNEGSQAFTKPEVKEGRIEGDGGYGGSQTFT